MKWQTSKSDKFENVLIIGPNKNVRVYYSKLRKIGNLKDGNSLYLARYNSTAVQTLNPRTKKLEQGVWIGYKNGKYYNSYDGTSKNRYESNKKPGGMGFSYLTLWDKLKNIFR